MTTPIDTSSLIENFFESTAQATDILYRQNLYGHLLVIIFSSIDSMGLLDAPTNQASASGQSFKDWVKKYILTYPGLEFNEIDFWASRCAVLHNFSSQSELSNSGKARQIQYFAGPKDAPQAKMFVSVTKQIENGAHVPANIEDTYMAFLNALIPFAKDLVAKCQTDPAHEKRLRNVLQMYQL